MADEPTDQGGIFGKLPDSRPGTRSPRRSGAKAKPKAATKAKPRTKASAKPQTAAKPKAAPKRQPAKKAPPREPAPPRPPDPETPVADQTPGGLGEIAWAGIAVAAEAATIGVRLASRAIEAVRGNPEKD
jgi:outer membrane biosynthesis protein TonB